MKNTKTKAKVKAAKDIILPKTAIDINLSKREPNKPKKAKLRA